MPSRRYRTFALHTDLVAWIDRYLAENDMGYRSRAEVISAAVREFIERRRRQTRFRNEASRTGPAAQKRSKARPKRANA